ncbi:hypothetical protein Tco_0697109 [Tanacetum coccineum]
METEVESMVIVPIQQVCSSVPLLILQSSISHLLIQYLLPVKNYSLQLSPPTSALQQSSSVLEMYYNLPPRIVSPYLVAIVASRAVDPVGPVPQLMAHDHSCSRTVLHEMGRIFLSNKCYAEETTWISRNASFLTRWNLFNFLYTVQDIASLPHAYDNENMHYFNPQSHDTNGQRSSLEQVIGNPTISVQTRLQLATYLEMYMFALTVSTEEPKNSKEAMADYAWIEAMQDELY